MKTNWVKYFMGVTVAAMVITGAMSVNVLASEEWPDDDWDNYFPEESDEIDFVPGSEESPFYGELPNGEELNGELPKNENEEEIPDPFEELTKEEITDMVLKGAKLETLEGGLYEHLLDNYVMERDYVKGNKQYQIKRGDMLFVRHIYTSPFDALINGFDRGSIVVVEKTYQKRCLFGNTVTTAVVVDFLTGRRFEAALNGCNDAAYLINKTNPNNETLRQQLGIY